MAWQDLDADRRSAAVDEDRQRHDHDPDFLDPSPVGSDHHMRSRSTVDYCASNQGAFFGDFVAAMTKLGRIRVKTPATGVEIRWDCRFPN